MNKTEAEYQLRLRVDQQDGHIEWFGFEAMKFEIGDGAWYTPDFMVLNTSGKLEAHEVKGGLIREAAMVRFKAAKKQYTFISWKMFQKKKGQWTQKF